MSSEALEILKELVPQSKDKLLLTKKETARLLGVSTTTIDNYMTREHNPLSYIKYGGSRSPVRFHITSIANFLASNKNIEGKENV